MKILVVAEKPAVGRDIARVLGCRQKRDGQLANNQYIVTWAIGHLAMLQEPEEYNQKYKKWSIDTLPILPSPMALKPAKTTYKQFRIVKELMNSQEVKSVICATDAGREGELIFRYIYQLAQCNKPVQRLWISSMTDSAIKEGFQRLKPAKDYDQLYYSAKCRSEADWLVGINASRAFTIKYKELLSIGRVQTPTLAMLVQRQKEIDDFKPQSYWQVEAIFQEFSGLWYNKKTEETRTYHQIEAKAIADKVSGKDGLIVDVKKESKKELPPLLYDLTELQRDANKKFGMSAQETLTTSQSLYERHKLITYPRTDSRYLSKDMISLIKPTIAKLAVDPYRQYAGHILSLEKLPITSRLVNDAKVSDHHAIIPNAISPVLAKLGLGEKRIYDLIVRRFFAVFFESFQYTLTTIITEVADESFISKGKEISQLGWKGLYQHEEKDRSSRERNKRDTELLEQDLPALAKNYVVHVDKVNILEKETKSPSPYTEASLLSAMEHAGRFVEDEELKEQLKEGGLGTPATRAAIIERLIKVGYVTRNKKALLPTEKGISLINVIPAELKSAEMTGKWEKGLAAIAKNSLPAERFMESIKHYVEYIVNEAKKSGLPEASFTKEAQVKDESKRYSKQPSKPSSKLKSNPNGTPTAANISEAVSSIGSCPICKTGEIRENKKGYGCTSWQSGCKFFIGLVGKKRLSANQVRQLITKGETGVIKGFKASKGGRFAAKLILKDEKVQFVYLNN
ncbi:MAG: DNA topoisomerase 3 [Bacillota bacterium]|nr:DNA topoisomerase 3 [Bacillota bacterium]